MGSEAGSHRSSGLCSLLRDIVLAKTSGPVVIFVDEIDSSLRLPFAADFFAGIRACYNSRAKDPEYRRITFVLLGVVDPNEIISDPNSTPFNIGTHIELTDFRRNEALVLAKRLSSDTTAREEVLDRVLFWTGGHPYLTQKVCQRASEPPRKKLAADDIDRIVELEFFAPGADRKEANLNFVRTRVSNRGELTQLLLQLYRQILRGDFVRDDPTSAIQNELKLSGLVKSRDGGTWLSAIRSTRGFLARPGLNRSVRHPITQLLFAFSGLLRKFRFR